MALSEIFGFLTIFKESIKLLLRTWKFTATITTLSLILPSIFLLLFNNFVQFVILIMIHGGRTSRIFIYTPLLIAAEIAFLLLYLAFSDILTITTVYVSSMAHIGKNISLTDLCHHVKRIRSKPANKHLRESRKTAVRLVLLGASSYVLMITNMINLFTICTSIFLTIILIARTMYASVVRAVADVVAAVEENYYEGEAAVKRAEELVGGQRHNGLMVILFDKLTLLVAFIGFWMMMGDRRVLNLKVYGLFFVNMHSLQRILRSVAWVVLYFQCKNRRREEVTPVGDGDLDCTKLLV